MMAESLTWLCRGVYLMHWFTGWVSSCHRGSQWSAEFMEGRRLLQQMLVRPLLCFHELCFNPQDQTASFTETLLALPSAHHITFSVQRFQRWCFTSLLGPFKAGGLKAHILKSLLYTDVCHKGIPLTPTYPGFANSDYSRLATLSTYSRCDKWNLWLSASWGHQKPCSARGCSPVQHNWAWATGVGFPSETVRYSQKRDVTVRLLDWWEPSDVFNLSQSAVSAGVNKINPSCFSQNNNVPRRTCLVTLFCSKQPAETLCH